MAKALLVRDGALQPLRQAMALMGAIVVPGSSLIVGARLYSYWRRRRDAVNGEQLQLSGVLTERGLHRREICALVATRYIVLPIIGRLLVHVLDKWLLIEDDLLRIYMMIPFFMPTASNSVVMVQMAAQRPGRDLDSTMQMERALLTFMFWQYAVAPLFLTANIALGLMDLEGIDI